MTRRTRLASHLALMASLCLLLVSSAHGAETGSNASGPYVRGAVAFGFLNLTQGGSTKTQFGFTGAVGYQLTNFLASDVEFTGTWGGTGLQNAGSASTWDIVVNARAYPLAAFGNLGDFFIRPYGLVGIGGGQSTVSGIGTGGAFVTNLGLGVDVMLGEGLGLYAEAAYKLFVSGQIDGISNVNAGVILRF